MMRADVTQIVLEAYDRWWRGDTAGARRCFHASARITVSGDPETVPLAGDYRGAAGVTAFLARLDATARLLMPTLQDLLVDGDCAVVRWTMPVRRGAVQAELQCVDILRLRQHRIVALEQVFDTGAAAKLFGTQTLPSTPQPDPACQNGAGASAAAPNRPGEPGS